VPLQESAQQAPKAAPLQDRAIEKGIEDEAVESPSWLKSPRTPLAFSSPFRITAGCPGACPERSRRVSLLRPGKLQARTSNSGKRNPSVAVVIYEPTPLHNAVMLGRVKPWISDLLPAGTPSAWNSIPTLNRWLVILRGAAWGPLGDHRNGVSGADGPALPGCP